MDLARLIRDRSNVTIDEMSKECGVSERTVYRYLNTLAELDIPGGYLVEPGNEGGEKNLFSRLGDDDLDIIAYCLGHNPLVRYSYIAKRLGQIRRKVLRIRSKLPESRSSSVLQIADVPERATNPRESEMVEVFATAKVKSSVVLISTQGLSQKLRPYQPVAIKVTRDGLRLVVRDCRSRRKKEIELVDVLELRVKQPRHTSPKTV